MSIVGEAEASARMLAKTARVSFIVLKVLV
jgi:hypothetical protein